MEQGSVIVNPNTKERYILGKKLGEGGFGAVYKATDSKGYVYALKLLHKFDQETIDSEIGTLREVSVSPQCDPNMVCYFDSFDFTDKGKKYYAILTEFIDGEDLSKFAQKNQLTPNDVFTIGIWLLGVLGFLHENKYVHRDIKPGNIMLLRTGDLKLIDFGISCWTGSGRSDAPKCTANISGTPGMIPPELLEKGFLKRKNLLEAYKAADIFATGVTLYELLTGELPYEIDDKTLKFTSDYRPLNTGIPCLDETIALMVHINPVERPTAEESQEMLILCRRYSLRAKVIK
jgi:serine/threonine protein kinase